MHGMSYAFVHFVFVPLTDGGNDRQRACTCHFFTVSGSLIPRPLRSGGRADQMNSKLSQFSKCAYDRKGD